MLTALVARLVPAGVRISAGYEQREPVVPPASRTGAEIPPVDTTAREREFALGRWHARRALRALGVDDGASLGRHPDGRPAWPAAVIGSISHTVDRGRAFAVAAVARSDVLAALGIDLEAPGTIAARHWPSLLAATELAQVLTLSPAERSQEVFRLWCAKEAVAKAMRPGCQLEAIVIDHDLPAAGFVARWPVAPAAPAAPRAMCSGQVLHHAGWTCAVAAQAARHASLVWPGAGAQQDE